MLRERIILAQFLSLQRLCSKCSQGHLQIKGNAPRLGYALTITVAVATSSATGRRCLDSLEPVEVHAMLLSPLLCLEFCVVWVKTTNGSEERGFETQTWSCWDPPGHARKQVHHSDVPRYSLHVAPLLLGWISSVNHAAKQVFDTQFFRGGSVVGTSSGIWTLQDIQHIHMGLSGRTYYWRYRSMRQAARAQLRCPKVPHIASTSLSCAMARKKHTANLCCIIWRGEMLIAVLYHSC